MRYLHPICFLSVVCLLATIGVAGESLISASTGGLALAAEDGEPAVESAESGETKAISEKERDQRVAESEAVRRQQLSTKTAQEEKIDELVAEIEENPDQYELHYRLANAYHEASYLYSALLQYNKAVEIDPEGSRTWVNRGVVLKDLGRTEEAEESFRRAIEVNTEDALAHINLGDILLTQKKYPEALDEYRTALRLEPGAPNAYYSIAIAFAESGLYRDAARAWRKCAELAESRGGPLDRGNADQALENAKLMDEIVADAEEKLRERDEKRKELEGAESKKAGQSD
jgi:tetratricopeptide (TPR) repeat protein